MRTAIVFALFAASSSHALAQVPAKDRMVVVISLDGFPAFALDNPKTPVPTLRSLIRNGVTARMSTVNPTVTWPNHTTMVTGVHADTHGLLANGTIVRTGAWPPVKVEPMIEKEKMVHAPTVYDAAFQAGLTTAQVDWVAIDKARTITWPFAEWPSAANPVEQEMIRKGVIAAPDLENFGKSNILFRDQVWTRAAAFLIREHKPNLMLFHLLSLDSAQHKYGPETLAATTAIAFLDGCVASIVEAVRAAGMIEKTTFVIVSDHGFKSYTREVRPAVALAAAGLGSRVYVLPEGGSAFVYFDESQAAELRPRIIQVLSGVEGIDKVISPESFASLGLPQPERDTQMFQLLLTAEDGYAFSGAAGGPVTAEVPQQAGGHGYPASDPAMGALFIASGYGVHPGATPARISNTGIASTIAKLLGVSLPLVNAEAIPLQ
jgi:predicted AlkP superfamily pyrophosphatase or phosphodiesterase